MENLTPLQKLDKVLEYLKDPSIPLKNDSTLVTFLNLKGYKYSKNDLNRIVQKLVDDKYIYMDEDGYYHFTFEGYYSISYQDRYENERVSNRRRNLRDFFLTWGTVLAGIAAHGSFDLASLDLVLPDEKRFFIHFKENSC